MTNTPNRYTLILLKDYANLSQIKVSPFTFWLLVTLFISAFLFCFIAIIISGFIWQNSNAIRLEKDALYKQLVAAQVRINRLTAVEDILYKKNINVATINKRSDVQEKGEMIAHAQPSSSSSTSVQTTKKELDTRSQKDTKETSKTEPVTSLVQSKDTAVVNTSLQASTTLKEGFPSVENTVQKSDAVVKKEIKENEIPSKTIPTNLESKVVALRNVKVMLQQRFVSVDMDVVNTSQSKQDGTIQYTIVTKENEYRVKPANNKKNSFYAINKMKDVKTKLELPKGVNQQMVVGVRIELLNENTPIVRIFEKL